MLIKKYINNILNSNTYLLHRNNDKNVWIIDPGDSCEKLIKWVESESKILYGILLTHTCFDHIYGLNCLQEQYHNVKIYASVYAKEGIIFLRVIH